MENTELNYEEEIKAAEARLAELKKAQLEKIEAEKAVAKSNRKADAEQVKTAISERLEAEINAKKIKAEAYRTYLETCDAADKQVNDKRAVESKMLTEFCTKYNEGFHDTITLGDISYNVNYEIANHTFVDPFTRLFNWFI